LDNTKLAGFSLSGKLAVIQALAGKPHGIDTDIQTLGMEVRQTPAGTDVDAIKMIVPSLGDLSGSGTVSPSHQLDFKMTAVLRTSQSSMPELASRGDTTVPFDITGTAENPVFRPDIKGMAREKIKDTIGKTGVGKAATDILDGILGGKRK
jgi:AsmA protein